MHCWPERDTRVTNTFVNTRHYPALCCIIFTLSAFGCTPKQPAISTTPTPQTSAALAKTPPPLPKNHVWREQVMAVMSPGLGAFLQRLHVQSVMNRDKFHGFRILELKGDPAFWKDVDIKPGDVVTSINEMPIGHYDEAMRVWDSLPLADSIVIAYEREQKPRVLRIEIHENETN